VAAEIAAVYESMRSEIPFLRIHGDCHPGNLLRDGRSFYFLDFDDFLMGPAVQDIWMLVPARDTEGIRQRNVFLDSYRVFRDFDDSWLRLIEPLRSLRYIHYAAWIARRWDDPAFKNAFAWFGTEEYWMNETADLEDQLDFIHGASPEFSHSLKDEEQPGEEKELTNADFFWDWDGK
jgi:Ser/Thr protein kinase RdoA (MazF antagonist)